MRRRSGFWGALAALSLLAACTGDLAVPTEPLRLLRVEWGVAYVDEPFDGALRPAGGLRPYRFELVDGALPDGLALQAGRLTGTPIAVGRFAFTVQVQDGNLSQALQQVEIDVRPLPTPVVRIDAPATELRGDVPLLLRVEDARGWRGSRVALTWDPAAFTLVAGPTAGDARMAVFSDVGEGRAWIEAAALGATRDGAFVLARLTLRPLEPPARLSLELVAASLTRGGEHVARRSEGARRPLAGPSAGDPGDDEPTPDAPPPDEGPAEPASEAADEPDEDAEEAP